MNNIMGINAMKLNLVKLFQCKYFLSCIVSPLIAQRINITINIIIPSPKNTSPVYFKSIFTKYFDTKKKTWETASVAITIPNHSEPKM